MRNSISARQGKYMKNPATPAPMMMSIGFVFPHHDNANAAAKSIQLHASMKFSGVISTTAAAPIRPATADLRMPITPLYIGLFPNLETILMIMKKMMNEGNTRANVVAADPNMLTNCEYPKSCTTVYPTNVALLMPIGPGVICDMATMSVNACSVSHACFVTTSACISDSIAYPPPIVNSPIRKNV